MTYKLKEKRFTKIIIDASKISTYEYGADSILLEAYLGDQDKAGDVLLKQFNVQLKKKNDFEYQGSGQLVIDGIRVGEYVWFRTKVIKKDGEESTWSMWAKEVAGDLVNELVFSDKLVEMSSTAVKFSVKASSVPEDFEKFVWKYSTAPANLLDGSNVPAQPTDYPDIDAIPDFETKSLDNISISFNENRTTWYHVWVRAIDESGNYAPNDSNTNYWYYIGCGKVLSQSSSTDIDNEPPDNSTIDTLEQ